MNLNNKSFNNKNHQNLYVEVLKKLINSKTGICYLLIRFWHSPSMSTLRVLPRSDIYNNSNILIDLGADVSDLKSLVKRISQQESQLDISYISAGATLKKEKFFKAALPTPLSLHIRERLILPPKAHMLVG